MRNANKTDAIPSNILVLVDVTAKLVFKDVGSEQQDLISLICWEISQ